MRKLRRYTLVLLLAIMGILVVLFVFLNLPFSQRYATRQVNQILNSSGVPIHMDAIRKILPGSVRIQGISIHGPRGDTIIYTGELQANIRLLSLIRQKVMLKDLELDAALVELERYSGAPRINIAEAFKGGERRDLPPGERSPTKWKIAVKNAKLTHIHFRMNDSLSGIHILQDASEIVLGNFDISIRDRNINCRSLYLLDAGGGVDLTPRLIPPREKRGPPWNLGFDKLALENTDFGFSSADNRLLVETSIGKGNIRINALDLLSKIVDIKQIDLDACRLAIRAERDSFPSGDHAEDKNKAFQWHFLAEDMVIRRSELSLGPDTTERFRDMDLRLENFRFDQEEAGLDLEKLTFEMDNGFSLRKFSAELESDSEGTELQVDMKSGHSQLQFQASAEEAYGDILSAADQMAGTVLKLEKSQVSLEDLSIFMPELADLPIYTHLGAMPIELLGQVRMEGPSLEVSSISLSQHKSFNIRLEGVLHNCFYPEDATGDMHLLVSALDQVWLDKLAYTIGITQPIPELSDLELHAFLSDSLYAPEISVDLLSQQGNVDVIGSVDFRNERFNLASSFEGIALGELLARSDLGSLTGAGELKGRGFSEEKLHASYYVQLDTFGFRTYPYSNTQLTGTIAPGSYGLQMVAKDPSFKGDLQLGLELRDSAYMISASGILQAQLDKLHLYEEELHLRTSIDGRLVMRGDELESELHSMDLKLRTPGKEAVVKEIHASFATDSVQTTFHADADFFHADLHLVKPLDELDSLGIEYQQYFESFGQASHITAANRVSVLPEINASISVSYHDLIDIIIGDSSLHFSSLEGSIIRQADQNSLHTSIEGRGFSYGAIESEKIRAEVSDSAGTLFLDLKADSASILSGPDHQLALRATSSNQKMLASINVDDYLDQNIYHIDLAGESDSNRVLLEVPEQRLILNREEWELDDPELLSIELADNALIPSLHMKYDSAYLHLTARKQDSAVIYALDLEGVELTSLVRNDIFRQMPDGIFTGAIEFRNRKNSSKNLSAGLFIEDLSLSGEDFSDIQMDGVLNWMDSGAYTIDLVAQMDSLNTEIRGGREASGDREMLGSLSHFPLVILEPFTEEYVSELGGSISGSFNLASQGGVNHFNGELMFQDAHLRVNLLNSVFRIPDQSIGISEERAVFNAFTVLDTLSRPLKIDGFIDFSNQNSPVADLNITSSEMQVMARDKSSRAPFTGNIFIDSDIYLRGPLSSPDLGGKINLSRGTEIYYQYMEDLRMTETEKIVNFASYSALDEELQAPVLSGQGRLGSTSIGTSIGIDPNTRINFTLARRMFDIYLDVKGGGNIQYNLDNDQMTLTGRYEVGEGTSLLKLVGWPNKSFRLVEGGYIRWEGLVENPELNLEAENRVSTSYLNPIDGRNRDIDFSVILSLKGYLSDLDVSFTIRTPDQYVMSIINTLSPEEQMRQAISVLLFEAIDLPGISSSTDYMTQQVNQILSSQLNQFTQSAIKGVDISFGLDTYDQSAYDGSSETTTSLSYEVSKTFMNNRAQIEFSGRLKDANQASTTTEHSLNNLSFEYTLDSAASKYLKVYNEHSYDDVFEGEVIQTGIGFKYKRSYKSFKDIWRRKR